MLSSAQKNWECNSTHTPNSELTAMLLSGTVSDPGIMQHTVGWNPGDLLYTPVLQVRVGHDTVMEAEVELCSNPSPLSSVGLKTSEPGDKSRLRSNRRLTSSCWKQNTERWYNRKVTRKVIGTCTMYNIHVFWPHIFFSYQDLSDSK